MKSKWIIDQCMIEKSSFDLINTLTELGLDYHVLNYKAGQNTQEVIKSIPFDINDPVIPYTSLNMGKHLKSFFGMFLDENNFLFHQYTPMLGHIPFLNNDFILTTFYDFKNNFNKYTTIFGNEVFIRPNSGYKIFTGMVINPDNFSHEMNSLEKLSAVMPNSLIIVARAKKVLKEFRFVICGTQVLDGCLYMQDHEIFEQAGYPTEAMELAMKVANLSEKPSEVFTCDIAQNLDGFSVVELNSFNCAAWYQCDGKKIIQEISSYVERKHIEENE